MRLYQQSTEPGNWNKSALSSEYVNPMVSCQSLVLKNDHSEAISENVHTVYVVEPLRKTLCHQLLVLVGPD